MSPCRGTRLALRRAAPTTGSVHGREIVFVHLMLLFQICGGFFVFYFIFNFWQAQVLPVLLNNPADVGPRMSDLPAPSVVWSVCEVVFGVKGLGCFLIDSRMGSEVESVWSSQRTDKDTLKNNSLREEVRNYKQFKNCLVRSRLAVFVSPQGLFVGCRISVVIVRNRDMKGEC